MNTIFKLVTPLIFLGLNMTSSANSLPRLHDVWNFSDPAGTEKKFWELIPHAQKLKDLEYELQVSTQIARAQGLQRKFDDAHRTLDTIEKRLSKQIPVATIRYHLERGRVFNSSKMPEKARPHFTKALEDAVVAREDNLAIDALHMLAIIEKEPAQQMQWNLRALKLAEDSKDVLAQEWKGSLYNNIGWTYHSEDRFNQALDMFQKALDFRESKKQPGSIRVAKWCVARTLRSLNRLDEALRLQLALKTEFDRLPEKDGYVFEELGELYLLKKDPNEARKYFSLAFEYLGNDEWFKTNEAKRLQRIKDLGEGKK